MNRVTALSLVEGRDVDRSVKRLVVFIVSKDPRQVLCVSVRFVKFLNVSLRFVTFHFLPADSGRRSVRRVRLFTSL